MSARLRVLAAVLVLVSIAAAFWFWRRQGAADGRIRFSGNIELTEARIAFKTGGRLAEILAREGDRVSRGAVLARLDTAQLEAQRERARAALRSAESLLAQLVTGVDYQRESNRGQLEQREAEVRLAEARLRDLQAGARPQEVEQARAAVARAQSEHEAARADWERAQVLYRSEDISRAQFDAARARSEGTSALLRQAQESLAVLLEGPRPDQVEAARADLARAQAGVRLARSLDLELRRREQEAAARRADVERARAELAVAESQFADAAAVAPWDGVVLVRSAEEGEVLAAGATVLTLGDITRPWLRGYVGETDLGRVRLGSRVKVTTDSFPGREYWGTVTFIASQAEFTPKQIQTQEERVKWVYRIKVDMPNPDQELKSNMPADAELIP